MSMHMTVHLLICFFFKQNTAYEMRISDRSSDVCSSYLFVRFLSLHQGPGSLRLGLHLVNGTGLLIGIMGDEALGDESFVVKQGSDGQIGRASCREGVCQYV